jgi:Fe-S oxidoreductase
LRRALGIAPAELTANDLAEWQELLYDACTMCGRCTVVCPMGIDIASLVSMARKGMVAAGIAPPEIVEAAERSATQGSALGVTAEVLKERIEWVEDEHEIEIPLDRDKADVLLTLSSVEVMKYAGSVAALARVLNHTGIDWTLSTKGYEATNFGVLSGRADVAKVMVNRIVEAAEAVGAKTVVIPECGHAYGVLRWSGANILGRPLPFQVLHITEFLAEAKRAGRLKLKPLEGSITYHDPCQISRRGGATAEARYILDGFAKDFREMTPTGDSNWCCGGGGGIAVITRSADLRQKVFGIKARQVEETGAKTLVSACSNCRLALDTGKANAGWQHEIESLVDLVAQHLDE